jgi:hypothetical protein
MSLSDLHAAICDELEKGELSFYLISQKLEVPLEWVIEVANSLNKEYDGQMDLFDYDGDALASAGFGTDEDY